ACLDIADIDVVVADDGGDLLQHAAAIVAEDGKLHGIATGCGFLPPLHRDLALGFIHQVGHIRAALRMHGDALPARDVADDLFSTNRIATSSAIHHQVAVAFHLDG